MIKLIKNLLFQKKEDKEHQYTKKVNSFVEGRPIDKIRLRDYYDSRFDNNEFYRLNIELGLIIFIDLTDNKEIEEYIAENYIFFKNSIELKGRTFIKSINDIEKLAELNINYFYPFLMNSILPSSEEVTEISLLNFMGYKGNIETGFLSFTSNGATFLGLKESESIDEFVNQYIINLNIDKGRNLVLYSLGKEKEEAEPNIEIDSETVSILNQIQDNLLKLKQSGQFFLVAPKLEKMIQQLSEKHETLSTIVIDEEFRIILPEYGNMEITLSHLTKAIYILFLRHPEGILLNDLYKYENELLVIYKTISYQVSLDKMKNSVQELISNDKAIFVHFSRIKSAFLQKFTDSYAKFYYVQGEKAKPKSIKLSLSKIIFEDEI